MLSLYRNQKTLRYAYSIRFIRYVLEENLKNIREAWKRIHGEF